MGSITYTNGFYRQWMPKYDVSHLSDAGQAYACLEQGLYSYRCRKNCQKFHTHNFTSVYHGREDGKEDGTIYGAKYAIPDKDLDYLYFLLTKCRRYYLCELRGDAFRFYVDYESKHEISGKDLGILTDTITAILGETFNRPNKLVRVVKNDKYPTRKFHIICPKIIVTKHGYDYLTDRLKDRLREQGRKHLSEGVDKTTSGLRMLGALKLHTPGVGPHEEVASSQKKGVYGLDRPFTVDDFREYSIFRLEYGMHLPLSQPRNELCRELEPKAKKAVIEFDDEELKNFNEFVVENAPEDYPEFEVQSSNNSLVTLKRKYPAACPLNKNRIHESRSAYMFTPGEGKILIGCDCEGKKKFWKKYRELTEEEEEKREESKEKREEEFLAEHIGSLFALEHDDLSTSDSKYVMPLKFNKKCLCIKAGLGTGKTTSYISYLREQRPESVLIITPRISFAESIYARLKDEAKEIPFMLYNKDHTRLSGSYIICQTESLWRLELHQFALVIVDEGESNLYQMTSIKTHGKNFNYNYDTFEVVLKNAANIVWLDAFLCNRSIQFLQALEIPMKVINYTRKLEDRTYTVVNTAGKLMGSLIDDLKEGKKIYFFCSSKGKLEDEFLPLLDQYAKDIKYIAYTSGKKLKMGNMNQEWAKYDLVATTATNTVGINFDVHGYFHRVYVYASASSRNLPRDIIQSTYRVRHLIDDKMVLFVDTNHYGQNVRFTRKGIEEWLGFKDKLHTEMQMRLLGFANTANMPLTLRNLYISNLVEYNTGIMRIWPLLERYLAECGYTFESPEDEDDLELTENKSPETEYEDIKAIDCKEAENIVRKRTAGIARKEELDRLEKYYFRMSLLTSNLDIEKALWPLFLEHKEVFENISYEKGLAEGSVCLKSMAKHDSDNYAIFSDETIKRLEIVSDLTDILGLKHTRDFESIIDRKNIEDAMDSMSEKKEEIRAIFSLTTRNKNKAAKLNFRGTVELINQVLYKWAKSKLRMISTARKTINGKRVYVASYDLEDEIKEPHPLYSLIKSAYFKTALAHKRLLPVRDNGKSDT